MARTHFQPKLEGNIKEPTWLFEEGVERIHFYHFLIVWPLSRAFHGRFTERVIGVFTTLTGTFYVHHLFTSYHVHRNKGEWWLIFTNLLVSNVENLQIFLTDKAVVKVSYNTLQKTRMAELYLSPNSGYDIDYVFVNYLRWQSSGCSGNLWCLGHK